MINLKNNNFRVFLFLFTVFCIHVIVCEKFELMDTKWLVFSYLVQLILSFFMLLGIYKVHTFFSNQVGFAFLGLLTLKIGISFAFANHFLFNEKETILHNKLNFLFLFMLFLSIEVYYTIKLLNKKPID